MTSAAPIPISAVPPHLQAQYRGVTPPIAISTPPAHTPTPPYGYSHPSAIAQPSNGSYGGYNGYPSGFSAGNAGGPLPPAQSGITPGIAEALANIPPEQKVWCRSLFYWRYSSDSLKLGTNSPCHHDDSRTDQDATSSGESNIYSDCGS